eukprot:1425983-Prorocentrum_lima.AAC.1
MRRAPNAVAIWTRTMRCGDSDKVAGPPRMKSRLATRGGICSIHGRSVSCTADKEAISLVLASSSVVWVSLCVSASQDP